MRFGRRRFLQLLAATGAALVSRDVPGLRADGPSGLDTSAAEGLTTVVYPPSPEIIPSIDNLVRGGVGTKEVVYWALGGMPDTAGAIYLGGVRVGSIRTWSLDRSAEVSEPYPGSRWGQYHAGPVRNRVRASGQFALEPDPLGLPAGDQVSLELRVDRRSYQMDAILEGVTSYGRDFTITGEGYNVQTKLG